MLSSLVDEERLTYGAAGYLAIALVYALGDLAAPRDFFSANTEPAAGVPSVALVVGAALVTLLYGKLPSRTDAVRGLAAAAVAVLAIYGLSLTILGIFQWIGQSGFVGRVRPLAVGLPGAERRTDQDAETASDQQTDQEIKEVILQSAIYCGVPDANNAFRIAAEVLSE